MTTTEETRDALRKRIEEGQARLAERDWAADAQKAADSAKEFVREHPIATVAGVATIGLLIGAMTRPGRRLGNRAADMVTYATEAGVAYALGVIDAAGDLAGDVREASVEKMEDVGDTLERTSRKAKRESSYLAATARDTVHDLGRKAGRKAGRTLRNTRNRVAS